MRCPDTDRLIDFLNEARPDAELEAHLHGCPSCQADLHLLREIPVALRPETRVPEHLDRRVLDDIAHFDPAAEGGGAPAVQIAISAVLGAITILMALVIPGSLGAGNPVRALLLVAVAALLACRVQIRVGKNPELASP